MILHGIEYQRPTSLNMRILADHVTYSFLAFMKSIFHFCLGCYCGGYSQNGRSNLSSFFYPDRGLDSALSLMLLCTDGHDCGFLFVLSCLLYDSAVDKRSPGRQIRHITRSGDPMWPPKSPFASQHSDTLFYTLLTPIYFIISFIITRNAMSVNVNWVNRKYANLC